MKNVQGLVRYLVLDLQSFTQLDPYIIFNYAELYIVTCTPSRSGKVTRSTLAWTVQHVVTMTQERLAEPGTVNREPRAPHRFSLSPCRVVST
jgi:hypothetical protein